jgi:hypothetical protein
VSKFEQVDAVVLRKANTIASDFVASANSMDATPYELLAAATAIVVHVASHCAKIAREEPAAIVNEISEGAMRTINDRRNNIPRR